MTTITEVVPSLGSVPTTADPATFDSRADALLGTALPAFRASVNTLSGQINTVSGEVSDNAVSAAADAVTASAAAAAAAAAAGAEVWVSGQAYVLGEASISPIDLQSYRANTATSGTTDPSASGDWTIIGNPPGLVFISTSAASTSAAIDLTGLNDTYQEYEIHLINIKTTALADNLIVRTSTDGGSSFDSAAANYSYTLIRANAGTVTGAAATNTYIQASFDIGGDTGEPGYCGKIVLYDPYANSPTHITFAGYGVNDSGADATITGGGRRVASQVVDAVRIAMSIGNILSGTVKLYGVKKA